MSKWRKWRELSRADRRLLNQAAVLLVYARLKLPFIDFRAEPRSAVKESAPLPPQTARAQAVARVVGIAAGHSPVHVACLHRSLVLWWLLRRKGIPSELRLGARAGTGAFEAHAWVECAGMALNERADYLVRYSPFGVAVVPVGRRQSRRLVTRRVS